MAGITLAESLMLAATTASAGASIYKGAQTKTAMQAKAAEAKAVGQQKEITRLQQLQETLGMNIAQMAAAGSDFQGTAGNILESNIKDAEYDLAMIRGSAASAAGGFESAGDSAEIGGWIGGVGDVIEGGSKLSNSGKL